MIDQRRDVEEQDDPGIEEPVGAAMAAEQDADDRADHHGDDEGRRDAAERHAEMEGQARRSPPP